MHDELLGHAVTAWAGQVVKSTRDGPMAVFGSASDALSAGSAMQRAAAPYGDFADHLAPGATALRA